MMKPSIVVAGMCSLLFCFQAGAAEAAGAGAGTAAPVSKAEADHRSDLVAMYEGQEDRIKQARELVKKGKYPEAIDLYLDVQGELDLLCNGSGAVESWKARKRYAEVGAELNKVRRQFGEILLRKSKNAFNDAKYNDAISFATELAKFCPAMLEDAEEMKVLSQSRQRGEERLNDASPDRLYPDLKGNEQKIAAALAEAKVFMRNRKFEEARRRIEAVYKLNPFNAEAAYLANQIYSEYYTAGYHRAQADVRSLMAFEAWQWVEPVFYRNVSKVDVDDGQIKGVSDERIQSLLDTIVFPTVKYTETNIRDVVKHLMRLSANLDNSTEQKDKKGVIIDYIAMSAAAEKAAEEAKKAAAAADAARDSDAAENLDAPPAPTPAKGENADAAALEEPQEKLVTLNVSNATLREVLDYISFLTDLPYRVLPDRIVIGAVGDNVTEEVFVVAPEAVAMITGDTNNQPDDAGEAEGEKDGGKGGDSEGELTTGKVLDVDINPDLLKKFFEGFGVSFPEGSSVVYENGKIRMVNSQENLNKVSELLRQLNAPQPMVQIELKSIEISENDMEELGFNWSLGTIGRSNGHESSWSSGQGINAQMGRALNALSSSITGAGATLVDNLSIFPDLFGSIKPFDSDTALNLSLTINALDRSDRTEMISAPSVIVADQKTADVNLSTVYYFPESWEELEVELDGGDGDSGYRVTITAPMPEFDEQTDVGTVFKVTPHIKKNRIIGLHLIPKVSSYVGKDSFAVPVVIERYNTQNRRFEVDNALSKSFEVWKPVIANRALDVQVNVFDGETLVLGGLSDSIVSTRLDKIPILGDIPFIGRLFQSQSEMSTRKNMLIFVTARLVDNAGLPINALEKHGGIPDVNR
ncbi:MAG: hypothetical protein IJY46_06925 [Lentisphaeria bacterium]|nr:hypothetical protein [Lentisphaeria bacterium]